MSQRDSLTVRDETGRKVGDVHVGSTAVLWRDRSGPVRSFNGTDLDRWIQSEVERIYAIDGQSGVEAFLGRTIRVSDEYSY